VRQVHRSNRLESLASALAQAVEPPLASPFTRETIVVLSRGVAAWLSTELAKQHGVWANPDFKTAFAWLRSLAGAQRVAAEPFQRDALAWSIAALLPAHLDDVAFADVRRYLADDAEGTKRLALAPRIAQLFERYILRRPQLVAGWHGTRRWASGVRRARVRCVLRERDPRACFEAFARFRVVAVRRRGPHGVEKLNALVEEALEAEGLLRPIGPWCAWRPVLVRENDYQVGLFNGDVGLVLPDAEDGDAARARFFAAEGTARKLAPSRLPPHEAVFAMTVHKAQGSEFDEVALVLPAEASAILTRELLYTALTRARRRVVVVGEGEEIAAAVRRPVERASGLRERYPLSTSRASGDSPSPRVAPRHTGPMPTCRNITDRA
jgi:Exodeoxyribonuclease V, gamma subunit/UvrD-like helicase C-terminal domain